MYQMTLKLIDKNDYKKARENTFLNQNTMKIREEFKGCLFVYDDGFERYVNSLDNMDELDQWLYTRWHHNKDE